jgi:hypothetical protein
MKLRLELPGRPAGLDRWTPVLGILTPADHVSELTIDELRIAWNEAEQEGEVDWSGRAVDGDADHRTQGSALLLVFLDPPSEVADEAADWFSTEHRPGLQAVPGVLAARRFESTRDIGQPSWLITYDLSDPFSVASPEWAEAAGTVWTWRLRGLWRQASRVLASRA